MGMSPIAHHGGATFHSLPHIREQKWKIIWSAQFGGEGILFSDCVKFLNFIALCFLHRKDIAKSMNHHKEGFEFNMNYNFLNFYYNA